MTKPRILIVDDEPLARSRVRAFLRDNAHVEIAGECADGIEGLEMIRHEQPDIVFLDVQMPGFDGLQLLAKLPAERRPAVILTTAHDRFALDAFSAQVVDYLLKPFDRERFETALRRAIRHARAQRDENIAIRIEGILAAPTARRPARLLVKADGRTLFIACDEIVWVEAESNYSVLHLQSAKRLILRETLTSLEKRIGASTIARVNRSALVHISQVHELLPSKYGDCQVVLRNGVRLPLSRTLRSRFEKLVTNEA